MNENYKKLLVKDKTGSVTGYCSIPWREILINSKGQLFNCGCEGKVTKDIGNILDIETAEQFKEMFWTNDFKKSILDGSYRYCKANICPFLQKSILEGKDENFYNLQSKLSLEKDFIIYLPVDRSCNLKCASCRHETLIYKNNEETNRIQKIIDKLNTVILPSLKHKQVVIRLDGSGELFASHTLLPWFLNFNFEEYSNVKFWIHTNATLISRYEDFLIKNAKNIFGFEVSIDAASKEVYEATRRNASWEDLLSGLETIDKVCDVIKTNNMHMRLAYSFTISSSNYKDINPFVDFSLTYKKAKYVVFYQIQDWGHHKGTQWDDLNIFNSKHPLHYALLEQVKNFDFNNRKVQSNLLYLKPKDFG